MQTTIRMGGANESVRAWRIAAGVFEAACNRVGRISGNRNRQHPVLTGINQGDSLVYACTVVKGRRRIC